MVTGAPAELLASPFVATDEVGLARVGEAVADADLVGVAVEMSARASYRPRLCLITLAVRSPGGGAAPTALMAVDPLAPGLARGPSWEAFARRLSGAPLVVHGGEYPIATLRRELRVRFPRLVDTQQAAVLLGLERTGLESLRTGELGLPPRRLVPLEWDKRPLDPEALAQALSDVADLPALHDWLTQRIVAADLVDELAVASSLVEQPPFPHFAKTANMPDPRRYRRMDGASSLSPEGLRVLGALVRWRDEKARELDLPPGLLFGNAQLVDLARTPERAAARVGEMRFHSRLVHSDRQALRHAVVAALVDDGGPVDRGPEPGDGFAPGPEVLRGGSAERPGAPLPRKGTPGPAVKARLARLKRWRQDEATARGIGLQGVLPAVAMEHLAFFPETPLDAVPGLGARRRERYADAIARLLG